MAIEDTSLMNEVDAILKSGKKIVHHSWRAEFRINGEAIEPLKVASIDIKRAYVTSFGDEIFLEVIFGAGSFAHVIYPNRKKLDVVLYREPIGEVSTETDLSQDIDSQVFTATLVEDRAMALEANELADISQQAGDLTDLKYVSFQLVDKALEQVRMASVGGIYRDTLVSDILKFTLTDVSSKIQVDESQRIVGVDMVEPNNTEPQKHVVVPHGMPFTDFPEFLVDKCAGIYNSGFGVYLQHQTWYVFPTHDLKRFEKAQKTLTLINVPKRRLPSIERTFRTTANQVVALVTGSVKHKDIGENLQLNDGNGVRFTDARKIMDGFATTENNRTTILRADNNNEYVAIERANGLNNVRVSESRITSNSFKEMSRLAQRKGSYVLATWENADPGLIFPGMPVKFMYAVKDEIFENFGVVQEAQAHTGTQQAGFSNRRHITNVTMLLFLDGNVEWGQEEGEEQ